METTNDSSRTINLIIIATTVAGVCLSIMIIVLLVKRRKRASKLLPTPVDIKIDQVNHLLMVSTYMD